MKKTLGLIPTITMIGSMMLAGCSEPQQQTTTAGTPTPTLEQRVTETQQPMQQAPEPTPTFTFNPTPFPYDKKSEMPLDSKLAFVAQDEDYVDDIWIFDGSSVRRLTHDLNFEHSLSWSADGKNIAYISYDSDKDIDSLRIINVETGETRDIYSSSESLSLEEISWSPDNKFIAFEEFFYTAEHGFDEESSTLNIINPKTLEKKTIAELDDSDIRKFAWIDETGLLFSFWRSTGLFYADIKGDSQVISETAEPFQVSHNRAFKMWKSYEEQQKIYRSDENGEISELSIPLGDPSLILNNGDIIHKVPLEKEEGHKLILTKYDENNNEVLRRDLLNLEEIHENENLYFEPVFEPVSLSIDENQILIEDLNNDIFYFFSMDGRHLRKLDFGQEYPFFHKLHSFAWSPVREDLNLVNNEDIEIVDNYRVAQPTSIDETLVFAMHDRNGRTDMWMMQGSNLERLTNNKESENEILLMPSGNELLYLTRERNNEKYESVGYIINLEGENRREIFRLDEEDQDIHSLQVSPDGEYISFIKDLNIHDFHDSLVLLNLETSEQKTICEEKHISSYDWSPDGKKILVTSKEYIERYDVESFETDHLWEDGAFFLSKVKYSPNGEEFVVSVHDGIQNRLYLGEIQNNQFEFRVIEENYSGVGFSWAPDSQSIIYSVFSEREYDENNNLNIHDKLISANINSNEKRVIHENIYENITSYDSWTTLYIDPKFSPNGTTILFGESLGKRIHVIDMYGNNHRTLPFNDNRLGFSPGSDYEKQSVFIP